jgi:hypothetical protein
MKSRPLRPVSSICCCVMSADRSPVVVCTVGDTAWTETVSVKPPTSSRIGRNARRWVELSSMPFCSWVLKPSILTVMS